MTEIHPVARFLSTEQRRAIAACTWIEKPSAFSTDDEEETTRIVNANSCCPLGVAINGPDALYMNPMPAYVFRRLIGRPGDSYRVVVTDEQRPMFEAITDYIMKNDTGQIKPTDVAAVFGIGPDGEDLLEGV